ncbi:MAG: hypothetical protein FIA89_03500 [Geobacter sp.]|nr:hypothetical protein [Geobacter sp.]
MKKSQQQQTKFRTVPLSDIPCFQGIAGKSQQAGSAQQPVAELPEFFKSVPGLAELFSKAPLKQKQATGPDCSECQDLTDAIGALLTCEETFKRLHVLVELLQDQIFKQADNPAKRRLYGLCSEISNLIADGQAAVDAVGIE